MQTAKVLASTATHKIESWQKRSPFIILILASIVGAATGLLGSFFIFALIIQLATVNSSHSMLSMPHPI